MGDPPLYVTFSVRLSIRPSVCPSITSCNSWTVHGMVMFFVSLIENDYSRCFFHFLKILICWAKNGIKGQKCPKFRKKLVCTVSEEAHMLWLWFLVHWCKMKISPGNFLKCYLTKSDDRKVKMFKAKKKLSCFRLSARVKIFLSWPGRS